jgi:3-deoxy-D-manno-octulosonate 8-phosphate phosphatase (KDO 8-P phosphatase)
MKRKVITNNVDYHSSSKHVSMLFERDIKVIIYDFDGVMTDNKVFVFSDGTEAVVCNRGDGLAVSEIKKADIHQCIISTESNQVVKKRAEKLGIPCIQGVSDKKDALLEYVKNNNIELKSVAYVGNDINDLEAMKLVAVKIAPKDAVPEVLSISDVITEAKGGNGVIYEIYRRYFSKH